MVSPQAAIMVLDHVPDSDEISELAAVHLEDFPAEEAFASIDIVYEPPAWLAVNERDQMSAHLRDGGPGTCILVIYMQEGEGDYDECDDDDL